MTGKSRLKKFIIVTILVTVSLLQFIPSAMAAESSGYLYYQVQPGDYLWLIGWKFETTAAEIMGLNHLTTTQIYPGQILKIPPSTRYVRDLPKTVSYTVVKGDTLYLIGQKFGVTADKIKQASGITSDYILIGQVLTVPLVPQQRYDVQKGDTLYIISKKFNTSIEALRLVNKMNSTILWIGQVLFVPATTPAPPGSTEPPTPPTTPAPPDNTEPSTPPDSTEPPAPPDSTQSPGTIPPVAEIDFSKPLPAIGQWGTAPPGVLLYHIQPGENLWVLAQRFHTTEDAIIKTNHLQDDLVQVNQPVFIPQNTNQSFFIPYPTGTQKPGFGELMDWEYASWIIDTHNIATITDIDTGKAFEIRRYGGSNHCDSEPLTAADAAIMKEIYGGQWSWASRAVTVSIGGKVLAASMAGMPHSFDSIPGNNFDGHFDLYFLNSRTHSDNTLAPDHQKMVLKAAGYN